ncbi:MAG: ParB/RepB/Spo0J family partition protein [Azospirillaceae bacterium]
MAIAKRSALGTSLSDLVGVMRDDSGAPAVDATTALPIEALAPGPFQPRRRFNEEELESLAASVRENGIIQPILVRPDPIHDNRFQIIAGERRWRAAQLAQLHEVPVIVRDLADADAAHVAVIENVQREDLSPIEEARGYRRLIEEFSHTQDALARIIGKSRPHIANTMRLLDLPEPVQDMVGQGQLSAGHARALIGAEDVLALARSVQKKGLSVRQTEALVRRGREPVRRGRQAGGATAPEKDADTLALERRLSDVLGLKVEISHRGETGGSIAIHYATLDQLDDVIERLGNV